MTVPIVYIKEKTLYLVSGVPASGKSSLFKNNSHIPSNMIVSTDNIRKNILGTSFSILENNVVESIHPNADDQVFEIAALHVEGRLSNGLTTFVDATMVNDIKRNFFAKIAQKYDFNIVVLVFNEDIEQVIKRDKARTFPVGESVIRYMHSEFQYNSLGEPSSMHELFVINYNTRLELEMDGIFDTANYDVIGDTHGCHDELILMLNKLGYQKEENGNYVHSTDPKRTLLFLGDYVDRGYASIETLLLIKHLTTFGHKAILGNHDLKIITFYNHYVKHGEALPMSKETLSTIMEFMRLDTETRLSILAWLKGLPEKFIYQGNEINILFCHANIQHFDMHTPRINLVKGDTKDWGIDTDKIYDTLYKKGINRFKLIRGHIPLTNTDQDSVISLDNHVAQGGQINALRLDDVVGNYSANKFFNDPSPIRNYSSNKFFNDPSLIIKQDVLHNVKEVKNKDLALMESMEELQKIKCARSDVDSTGLLRIFKYTKSVFFNQMWKEHHDLLKARGLVFDISGKIVHHSFDKVFNYSEPNENNIKTAIDLGDDVTVQAIEKLNGFLGGISKHPVLPNTLLNVTSGSFNNDFTGYTMDLILQKKHKSNLLKFVNEHPNTSLMFEVIHPDDPHIIKYDESEYDIYLIGVRDHAFESKVYTEDEIDNIALQLNIKRPKHFVVKFGELKDIVKNCDIEGYMVRELSTSDYICKFKSPYYLVTKFLGRLSKNNTTFMFKNPNVFKQKIDEEFYDIVDYITNDLSKEVFELMSDNERVNYVRGVIGFIR